MSPVNPALRLAGVTKRFGRVEALSHVDFAAMPGRVHALVGENGAGKSTILNVATGALKADAGEVICQPGVHIGLVHQHFVDVPTLTALESLSLGHEHTRFGLLELSGIRDAALRKAAELGLEIRLDVQVSALSIVERQRLEILRVLLALGSPELPDPTEKTPVTRVLLFDEPTALLPVSEAKAVLTLLRHLANQGAAVVLVSHRMDEVTSIADEVTILRRGKSTAHFAFGDPAVRDAAKIREAALGAIPTSTRTDVYRAWLSTPEGRTVLRLRNLHVQRGAHRVFGAPDTTELGEQLSIDQLDLHAGEIVGIAAIEGNGQLALELVLSGLAKGSGTVEYFAKGGSTSVDWLALSPRARRVLGMRWIPSDRHRFGLPLSLTVVDALQLTDTGKSLGRTAHHKPLEQFAYGVQHFELRPDDPSLLVGELSGGNQQKLLVTRELRHNEPPSLILACHPTRGIDARASQIVQTALAEAAAKGAAVLWVSSDLEEIRAVSHRIAVLRNGSISAVLGPDASQEQFAAAMMGGASKLS